MSNPIIKIKRGSGSPVSLQTGELALDTLNKSLFIGTAEGVLAVGGENVFAKKTFVSDAVAAEATLRSAADATITTNLNSEISRATASEGVIAAGLAQEILDRAAAVSAEASSRVSGDNALDAKISTEKGRVDAILSAVDADKDTFAEIVTLINSVDTTNDTAFAGYVTSNNAALASEISTRASDDTALGGRIDGVVTAATALASRVTAAESDINAEESARAAAVSAEASARAASVSTLESADSVLQSNITAEASTRATADTSLSNRIGTLESVGVSARLTDLESDVADHESRIAALETTIDGGTY